MVRSFLIAVFGVNALLLLISLRQNFVTVDEVVHVPSGLSHWETGTFIMCRVSAPLPDMLAALPILLAQPKSDYRNLYDFPGSRCEWEVGHDFAAANGSRYFDLVCLARLPGIFWSLLGGWVIYLWARDLYGVYAGCLGVVLWCFEPTIFTFAQLVLTDVPTTVAGLAATYVFWRYLRNPSLRLAYLSGLLLGVAELTKFTMLALYPIWFLLWVIYRLCPLPSAPPILSRRTVVGHAVLVVGLSGFVLNLGYAFHQSGTLLGDIPFISRTLSGEADAASESESSRSIRNRFRHSVLASLPVPLPEDYVRGIDVQKRDFEGKLWSYLRGEWRRGGWWYYYLYALAVKVPLGLWALVLWSLILTLLRHKCSAPWQDELALWLPALFILVLVSSQTGFNHHMRYVLPMFPFALISTSKLAWFMNARHWKSGVMVLALMLWFLTSSLTIYPHSMSYFNEAAGGPEHGSEHLVDSNIDWGQDLLFLKKWMDQHPEARPMKLAYYNNIDPHLVGIEYELPPHSDLPAETENADYIRRWDPRPGYYAVDVNFVRGGAFVMIGKWGQSSPVSLHDYEYFQFFKPIAKAGYSIYIYHITREDANHFRREWGLTLLSDEACSPENKP